MEKYEINFTAVDERDLTDNPWLLNSLKNRLKQVFMTPKIIVPGKPDDLVDRIIGVFRDKDHNCKLLMGIPGSLIEILVDNTYLIHFIFLANIKQPKESRVTVSITKLQISPIANSDTEAQLEAN